LIALGDKQTSLAQLPHDLIFDRVYIHGNPDVALERGITLNSASTAIIDSYISDCHEEGANSQAIMGWNGPGPLFAITSADAPARRARSAISLKRSSPRWTSTTAPFAAGYSFDVPGPTSTNGPKS
jgi:hypothetical protein